MCVRDADQSPSACGGNGLACAACGANTECLSGACAQRGDTCLELSPADLDFGPTSVGCSSLRSLVLSNRCSTPLDVTALQLPMEVGLDTSSALPVLLQPGASTSVQLRFTPASAGKRIKRLTVDWTSGGPQQSGLGVFGEGVVGAAMRESFTVPNRADILFVIDNSCSMSDRQSFLSTYMSSFLDYATGTSVNWNAAVINHDATDPATTGRFIGSPAVLHSTQAQAEAALATRVQLGNGSYADERGLFTAWTALTPPNIYQPNTGLLRSGATLSIVFVTDEDDHSGVTTAAWVNHYRSLRGEHSRNRFTVGGVVPPPPSSACSNSPSNGAYLSVIRDTGSEPEDICHSTDAMMWARVGATAAGRRAVWFLAGRPLDAQGMTVEIDGVAVPSQAWSLDTIASTVTLQPMYEPAPGQTIAFGYTGACVP